MKKTSQKHKKMAQPRRDIKPQSGPKPDLLRIEGDWQEAVKKSLEKKKPADGWPK